jgi:hypothetical protein
MNVELQNHIDIHLRNPHRNYIILTNCRYCKLDRRIQYGNHFQFPQNLHTRHCLNVNFNYENSIFSNHNNHNDHTSETEENSRLFSNHNRYITRDSNSSSNTTNISNSNERLPSYINIIRPEPIHTIRRRIYNRNILYRNNL